MKYKSIIKFTYVHEIHVYNMPIYLYNLIISKFNKIIKISFLNSGNKLGKI